MKRKKLIKKIEKFKRQRGGTCYCLVGGHDFYNSAFVLPLLENKEDPFLILQKDDMTYIQTLWTPEGYDLEYQEGNIFEHYWLSELANKNDIIWALQNYLKYQPYWKTKFKFEKKDIATLSYKIGHKMGYFFGKITKLFSGNQ